MVDVEVKFPKGFITEWYPQALEVGPSTSASLYAGSAACGIEHIEATSAADPLSVSSPAGGVSNVPGSQGQPDTLA